MFNPLDGHHGLPGLGGGRQDGGSEEIPPDLISGSDLGEGGPVLPDDFDLGYAAENDGPGDLLDIGLHFYERMNEI